jgi:hypothetical protein
MAAAKAGFDAAVAIIKEQETQEVIAEIVAEPGPAAPAFAGKLCPTRSYLRTWEAYL